MNKLGWFLTFGTFGQAFAALIVTVSLIARPLPAYQRQTVAFQTGTPCALWLPVGSDIGLLQKWQALA